MKKQKKESVVDKALQRVQKVVDEVTDPASMSRSDYKDFLGALIGDMRVQLEGAEQEDADEG